MQKVRQTFWDADEGLRIDVLLAMAPGPEYYQSLALCIGIDGVGADASVDVGVRRRICMG